jgi:hypothetical protein
LLTLKRTPRPGIVDTTSGGGGARSPRAQPQRRLQWPPPSPPPFMAFFAPCRRQLALLFLVMGATAESQAASQTALIAVPAAAAATTTITANMPPPQQCEIIEGWDLTGNDLLHKGKPAPQPCPGGPGDCCTMCAGKPESKVPFGMCRAWSFNHRTKTCWMKSSNSSHPNHNGDTSGVIRVSAPKQRQVRWWMNSGKAANNLKLIDAHPRAITGLYTYAGFKVEDSGHFVASGSQNSYLEMFRPYWARGLTVTPALGLTNESVISGNAVKHVAEVAAFAKSINVSGLMLDFEPSTSEISWVHAYANYVSAFSAAMHAQGLKAEMCVSSWGILDGHLLPNGEGYGVYAKTGVDVMMSMAGTYFGTNVSRNLQNVDKELKDGVSLSQLAAGIGTQIDPKMSASCPPVGPMGCKTAGGQCYNWSEAKLTSFVASLVQRGVHSIDMWRADIDAEGDCTEPYYFKIAENFLAGDVERSRSNKNGDKPVDSPPQRAIALTPPPLQVGNATQPVFRDNLFVAHSLSAKPQLNPPAFDIVALQAEHLPLASWEKGFTVEALGTSVVRDPSSGKIRMYYVLRWAGLNAQGVPITHLHPTAGMFLKAFAESDDGIHFVKPQLQSKPFNSSLNGVNVSASNIICGDDCVNIVWVENGTYWGAGGGKTSIKIWQSIDGIDWRVHGTVPVPKLDGMQGLDTMQDVVFDPSCNCHALFTRLWFGHTPGHYTGAYRMVRRANFKLSGPQHGEVTKQAIVLRSDAVDEASHTPVLPFPVLGFYGAT